MLFVSSIALFTFSFFMLLRAVPEKDSFLFSRKPLVQPAPTLDEYFQIWYDSRIGTIAPSTAYNNERRYAVISRFIGTYPLNTITQQTIAKLQHSLLNATIIRAGVDTGRHYAPRTVREEMALLSSILKSAAQSGLIEKNPCLSVKSVRDTSCKSIRDGAHRALNDSEMNQFFSEARNSFYYPLLVFLSQTGCRAGEAAALTWNDIDFENRSVFVHRTLEQTGAGSLGISAGTKTASGIRKIRLSPQALQILKQQLTTTQHIAKKYPASKVAQTDLVFTNTCGGFVSRNNINTAIMTIVKRIRKSGTSMASFSSHAFRHSFATKCVEQGMQPEILKGILGHSDIKMTMGTYYHLSQARMDGAMDQVEIPLAS